jgi:hypothetical protein
MSRRVMMRRVAVMMVVRMPMRMRARGGAGGS